MRNQIKLYQHAAHIKVTGGCNANLVPPDAQTRTFATQLFDDAVGLLEIYYSKLRADTRAGTCSRMVS